MKTLCSVALVAASVLTVGASLRADLPVPPGKGAPAKVELTVTASSAETVLAKGVKNARPVTLTFAFKNVSKEEIKLDTTLLDRNLLRLVVTGPDGKLVPAQFLASAAPPGVEPRPRAESQTLAAGAAWKHKKDVPGLWNRQRAGDTVYTFDQPGTYKIKAVYNGKVTSKQIELNVKKAGK
jgi:hypothetical protein